MLLAKALASTDRVAIVHFALRSKTRLAALRIKDFGKSKVMVVHTLLWPDEIREPHFPALGGDVEVRAPELKMAGQVVESITGDFHPEQYTDTYQEQLQVLVESKLAGGQAFAPAEAPARLDETEDVSDLLAKLEASVRRRREQSANKDSDAPPRTPATKAAPKNPVAAVKKAPVKKAPVKKAPARKAPARKVSAKK